jgi:hypothetical protein
MVKINFLFFTLYLLESKIDYGKSKNGLCQKNIFRKT